MPTFADSGLPSVNPESFRFIAAPAGLPTSVQTKLGKALGTAMAAPGLQARLLENNFEPALLTDREARAFVGKELQRWRQVVKDAGVRAN